MQAIAKKQAKKIEIAKTLAMQKTLETPKPSKAKNLKLQKPKIAKNLSCKKPRKAKT